jgi:hypothetical protein
MFSTLRTGVLAALAVVITAGTCLAGAPPARADAVGPQVTFGVVASSQGIDLQVGYPRQVDGQHRWELSVALCNRTTRTIPVGPETFSWSTSATRSTWFTLERTTLGPELGSFQLKPGGCASGGLSTTTLPQQVAFHDLRQGLTIDVVQAGKQSYEPTARPVSAGATGVHGDVSGDRVADVYGQQGLLTQIYRTVPGPALSGWRLGGTSEAAYRWISRSPDLDGNGYSDLVASTSDGRILYLRVMEQGRIALPIEIGRGWASSSLFAVIPGTAPGAPTQLFARNSSGQLLRYSLSVRGLTAGRVVGTGWGGIRTLFSIGDLTGDGIADLLAVRKDGGLFRYALNGTGSIWDAAKVGRGWGGIRTVASPGDLDGDQRFDMIGIASDGTLYAWFSRGNGTFSVGRKIGQNWQGVDALA